MQGASLSPARAEMRRERFGRTPIHRIAPAAEEERVEALAQAVIGKILLLRL